MNLFKSLRHFVEMQHYLRENDVHLMGSLLAKLIHRPQLMLEGELILGSDIEMLLGFGPVRLHVEEGAVLEVGNRVTFNSCVLVHSHERIEIGDYTLIGRDVTILDANTHAISPRDKQKPRPVIIGRNCWIGEKSVITPGVRIGDHSVVAPLSRVTENVHPQAIVEGNPAHSVDLIDSCPDDWIRRFQKPNYKTN